jgi:hypothetical protein
MITGTGTDSEGRLLGEDNKPEAMQSPGTDILKTCRRVHAAGMIVKKRRTAPASYENCFGHVVKGNQRRLNYGVQVAKYQYSYRTENDVCIQEAAHFLCCGSGLNNFSGGDA